MSDTRTDIVLRVDGLTVSTDAGRTIVDSVSFQLAEGEILGVVGESGCGKTTTARALLGKVRAGSRITGGAVILDGQDLLTLSPEALRRVRGERIAYVPQDPMSSLNPRMRVGAQVAEVLRVHHRASEATAQRIQDTFAEVGLPNARDFLQRYPFELSGGQQQRVLIGMALVGRPKVVVLDEPTTGLDVTTQARILELLRGLSRTHSLAFVYVSHDLAAVQTLVDSLMVMYDGKVVERGPAAEVFRSRSHEYTQMLFDAVPRLHVKRELHELTGLASTHSRGPEGLSFRSLSREPQIDISAQGSDEKTPVLEASDLVASYGRGNKAVEVLHGASFEMIPGECLAVVGESGSGKSTLGRCIVGLHELDSGSLLLAGESLAPRARERSRAQRRDIQIVFQNPDRSLNPRHTVAQALMRPLKLFGTSEGARARADAGELLDRVRLPTSYLDRYPGELSGGEKQRVAIARALAAGPSVIVCDEVTSALDVSVQASVMMLLDELRQDGLALLFITHNLALVNTVADRVLVVNKGQIVETGDTASVVGDPQHHYTRELLAAAPDLVD
ncbi:hypothetical protein LK09_08015 [Microbacterium mangrovi]|uniref:ABC transporter domain-containing protein n=2 Tax=Microbacterium mangrovi TaxID=1348253 RepID=A0A0B2A5R5_9MICO|nr:hypothetical protein LK09_08015 [Microbacterium mangrovi]